MGELDKVRIKLLDDKSDYTIYLPKSTNVPITLT